MSKRTPFLTAVYVWVNGRSRGFPRGGFHLAGSPALLRRDQVQHWCVYCCVCADAVGCLVVQSGRIELGRQRQRCRLCVSKNLSSSAYALYYFALADFVSVPSSPINSLRNPGVHGRLSPGGL